MLVSMASITSSLGDCFIDLLDGVALFCSGENIDQVIKGSGYGAGFDGAIFDDKVEMVSALEVEFCTDRCGDGDLAFARESAFHSLHKVRNVIKVSSLEAEEVSESIFYELVCVDAVSYTHLTLPTTPYV